MADAPPTHPCIPSIHHDKKQLLDDLFASQPDLPTRVVLVPSLNDVFHDHVFPQVRSLRFWLARGHCVCWVRDVRVIHTYVICIHVQRNLTPLSLLYIYMQKMPQPPLADRIPGGVPSPWFEEERIGDLGLPFAAGASPLLSLVIVSI